MQFAHGHGPVAGEYFRQDVQGEVDALVEQVLFAAWGASEHVAGYQAGVPRVADAEPQAMEVILVAELGDDVAQAVVPAVAAALFELGDAGWHVEFVVGHQDFFGFDLEEIGQGRHGLAAAVHVGGGDEQANFAPLVNELAHQAEILAIDREVDALALGHALNEKGPCIVPGLVVFGAGVTQANDQLYGSHTGALLRKSPGVIACRAGSALRLLGSAFFVFNAAGVDVGDSQVVTVSQSNQLNAFRQLQVGHVDSLANFYGSHVDFDEFRQVFRQAGNFDFADGVGDLATLLLHANGGCFVDEVQGYVGGQFLAGYDALEVSVQNEAFGRVALQGFDQNVFFGTGNVQAQDVAEGSFVFQQLGQVFGQQADRLRGYAWRGWGL